MAKIKFGKITVLEKLILLIYYNSKILTFKIIIIIEKPYFHTFLK